MQALFDLVHSLAKEEKRLYNLHGRAGRFTQIYKGYAQAEVFSKELDRGLYQKHFSTFSKAFYSMQKSALMEDILAVLLEYSNTSQEAFNILRLRGKYEVLQYRHFPEAALGYLHPALEAAEKLDNPRQLLRILEDQRDLLAQSEFATWEKYQAVVSQIESTRALVAARLPIELAGQELSVILSTASKAESKADYQDVAWRAVERIQALAQEGGVSDEHAYSFDAEYRYSIVFEDKLSRHTRLVAADKASIRDSYPRALRFRIILLLMESSMECGDFLLINGIIYKANKEVPNLTAKEKAEFMPRYVELCSLYHFYENELPLAQKELNDLLQLPGITDEQLRRFHSGKVAYCIAANMPKYAQDALEEMFSAIPDLRNDVMSRLMELMIAVEANKREDALVLLQRMRVLLRKSADARKLAHFRVFLEMLQKHLMKKKVAWVEVPAFQMPWPQPLKPSLWLKAKIENKFYYNYILLDWQGLKRILKT